MKKYKDISKAQKGIYLAASIVIVAMFLLLWFLSKSFLGITVEPKNARVTVDNAPIYLNQSGYAKATLKPGDYTIKIEADGYISKIRQITLKRAGSARLNFDLDEIPPSYQITGEDNQVKNVQFVSQADDFNSIFFFADNASTLYKARFKINDQGDIETLYNRAVSNPPITGIKKIIWSPKKDAAIFKKDNGIYFFDFKKYNFVSQEEEKYGQDIGDIAWSPDDSKIAYYYAPSSGEKSLIFANKTNTEITRVANFVELGIENPFLSWSPDSEWLIMIPRNNDINQNKIYLFNAYTRSFKQITDTGGHLEAKFSPNGEKIIYGTYSNNPSSPVRCLLSIMDKDGSEKRNLELRAYVGKTAWLNGSNSEIVVATYDSNRDTETIFGYNINNKEQGGFLLPLDKNQYVKELSLSQDNNLLFYIANDSFYVVETNK